MPPKLLSMQPIFADSSSDEDVEASGEWLGNVDEALAPSTFKTLSVRHLRVAKLTIVLHECLSSLFSHRPNGSSQNRHPREAAGSRRSE